MRRKLRRPCRIAPRRNGQAKGFQHFRTLRIEGAIGGFGSNGRIKVVACRLVHSLLHLHSGTQDEGIGTARMGSDKQVEPLHGLLRPPALLQCHDEEEHSPLAVGCQGKALLQIAPGIIKET